MFVLYLHFVCVTRMPLPILGDFLGFHHGTVLFPELKKKYGDIFGFWKGDRREVVVSDFDLIQELGSKEEFSARPPGLVSKPALENGDVPGLVFSSGKTWVEQRRYTLHTLRDLGFGKHTMEDKVMEQVEELCTHISSQGGQAVDMRIIFNVSILNALWYIISNEKLSRESTKLISLLHLLDLLSKGAQHRFTRFVVPLMPIIKYFKKMGTLGNFKAIHDLSEKTLQDHESTYQEDNMRDFIDVYLKEIHERSSRPEPSSFKGKDGRSNLLAVISDLFVAGSETTSAVLNWGILFMILHPDIQKIVQKELDEVTGKSRLPLYKDRTKTPYTEAVIQEIFRLGNILPLGVPHYTATGGTLGNGKYYIPPNTSVIPELGAVLKDPKIFPDPEKFDPDRHLNKNGTFAAHPKVIPFGLGRRRCLGETLAKLEFYVFFTGILSRFTVESPVDKEELSLKPLVGISALPRPYSARFVERN